MEFQFSAVTRNDDGSFVIHGKDGKQVVHVRVSGEAGTSLGRFLLAPVLVPETIVAPKRWYQWRRR